MQGEEFKNYTGVIIFKLHNKEYCTCIEEVVTIIKPEDAKFMTPERLNYNGTLIPVINLSKYLNDEPDLETSESRILVVETSAGEIAFQVHKIIEIISFDRNIKEIMEFRESQENYLLKGEIIYHNRALKVPDFNSINKELLNNNNIRY